MGRVGTVVSEGSVQFTPALIADREFRTEPGQLSYLDVAARSRVLEVPAGSAAFTLVASPWFVHVSGSGSKITITSSDSDRREVEGPLLDPEVSRQIFEHTGHIERLDVFMPREAIR